MSKNTKNEVISTAKSSNNNIENNSNDKFNQYDPLNLDGLESAIDQYLKALQEKVLSYSSPEDLSYNALTSLGAFPKGSFTENLAKELHLVLNFRKRCHTDHSADFYYSCQRDSNYLKSNFWYFHHFLKNFKPSNTKYRIYLNCQNQNISDLAEQIFNNFENLDKYYFKMMSDHACMYDSRSEKFVFYSDDEQNLKEVAKRLIELKEKNPYLFAGSENVNPFFETKNGFLSIAKQLPTASVNDHFRYLYTDLQNHTQVLHDSTNSALAFALEESLLDSTNKLMTFNSNFNEFANSKISSDKINNTQSYVNDLLPEIMNNKTYYLTLLSNMHKDLEKICESNPELYINGISKTKILPENLNDKSKKDLDD